MQTFEEFPVWQWAVPKQFNIGAACTDKHLHTPIAQTVAMIVEDDALGTSQMTFANWPVAPTNSPSCCVTVAWRQAIGF